MTKWLYSKIACCRFQDDPDFRPRTEDDIIAFTWAKYMNMSEVGDHTRDPSMLLYFPMVKVSWLIDWLIHSFIHSFIHSLFCVAVTVFLICWSWVYLMNEIT